jgi:hypothetical protein
MLMRSGDILIRAQVKSFLQQRRMQQGTFLTADVGGSGGLWLGELIDTVIDLVPPKQTSTHSPSFIGGDICDHEFWRQIPDKSFDFVNCTHTLEDLRDPKLVIDNLKRIARSGFIAVPNKHTELSHIESNSYLGYCHHRWIFSINNDVLYAYPKTLVVNLAKDNGLLKWVDSTKVGIDRELSFFWNGEFQFQFISGDFAESGAQMLDMLGKEVALGL